MTRGRVLIVENDDDARARLEDLARPHADPHTVTNAADAARAIEQHHFHVVIARWDDAAIAILTRMQRVSPNAVFVAFVPRERMLELRDHPSLRGTRVVADDSSDEIISLILQQSLALARMRDSTKLKIT